MNVTSVIVLFLSFLLHSIVAVNETRPRGHANNARTIRGGKRDSKGTPRTAAGAAGQGDYDPPAPLSDTDPVAEPLGDSPVGVPVAASAKGRGTFSDGTPCFSEEECSLCANPATFWPGMLSFACGTEPCWGDGTLCLAGTTCNQCCNQAFTDMGTTCGGSPWPDGTLCGEGTTCNLCANQATYWPSKVFTACGSEPCWGAGTVCGSGTTCNTCCNDADCPWWQFGVCTCK